MDCIIQVFPDEFHLESLGLILGACKSLGDEVNVKGIVVALLDRLADYLKGENEIPDDIPLLDILSKKISEICDERGEKLPQHDVVALNAALVNLAIKINPDESDFIETIMKNTASSLSSRKVCDLQRSSPVCKELRQLLKTVIGNYEKITMALDLGSFLPMLDFFSREVKEDIAVEVLDQTLLANHPIDNVVHMKSLLEVLSPPPFPAFSTVCILCLRAVTSVDVAL